MEASGGMAAMEKSGSGQRKDPRPFKIDHTSLLSRNPNGRTPLAKSPSLESDTDRVSFIKGALGDKTSGNENGHNPSLKPMDTALRIDRTQSLMTPAGYSTASGSSYRPLHRRAELTRSLVESDASTPTVSESQIPKPGLRAGLVPTALTSSTTSGNALGMRKSSEGLRGSQNSLIRAASSSPSGALGSREILNEKESPLTKESKKKKKKKKKEVSSSSDSSNKSEEEDSLPQRRVLVSPSASSDRSGNTTPYSTNSRTPAASPLPKSVLENHSPPNGHYISKIHKAEIQHRDTEKGSAAAGLRTALELAQRRSAEDKKVIEDLKKQIITCREDKNKEDPVLKAALEDALRELRENKEIIAALSKDIEDVSKKNEYLKDEMGSLENNLEDTRTVSSKEINDYRQKLMALEEENLLLRREKDEIDGKLANISMTLDAQQSERMRDRVQLETSLRDMEEKVTHSQKDKLFAAIKTDDIDAIENLLQSPIDLDAIITQDNSGRRAIHLLAENVKFTSIVHQLIDAKVDINAIDCDGETALHIAARSGRGRIVKALLEAKADWKVVNIEGWTAVQVAAAVGNLSALEEFRKHDTDSLRSKDGEGSTLLHYACANSQKKTTKWLVRHGSNRRRRDAFGLAAKDYKEAAKPDDGLLACFGSGGNRMAQEQLPRLQLEYQDSIRRSRVSSRSVSEKAVSDVDQASSVVALSEKQFPVSLEEDSRICLTTPEPIEETQEEEEEQEDTYSTANETPLVVAEITPEPKKNISYVGRESLRAKLSVASDSGRSTVSLATSTSTVAPPLPKTPPPSAMPRVRVPLDESLSEDQCSDVSMISSQRSFKERLPTGIPNLGNTSYMNAIIQCLYYTKPLSDSFISNRYRENINRNSNFKGEVTMAFGNVIKALRTGKQTYAAATNMKNVAGICHSSYLGDNTSEPSQFLQHLLQWLHQDLAKDISSEELTIERHVSLISTLFFGVHQNTVVCQESGEELLRTEEAFSVLSLPVEDSGASGIQEMLIQHYRPMPVQWPCSECGKEHICLKKKKIVRPPSNLIIHVDRSGRTDRSSINYPLDGLTLTDYLVTPNSDRGTYELYAICNQKGHGLTSHHTACCMTANLPIWCFFNDLSVHPIDKAEVVRQANSSVFFYKMSVVPYLSTGV